MRKRGYCLFICIILLVAMFIPLENVQAKAKPKLSAKNKTMYVGKTAVITLKNAGKVKWKTSKKSVVTITKKKKNKVTISAKKAGKATITATYKKKTYKCRITVKTKKAEQDNPVLNATDVSLYYLGDTYKSYIQYDPNHLREFRFRVSGTKKEVRTWKLEGEGKDFFQITDYGLVTMTWGPSYSDWSQTATVKAILEDGRVLTAKVTCYAESNIYANELFEKFESQYITAGMTDKEKAEKAAWYIGYTTDYQEMQNDWMILLFAKKGDCLASRYLLQCMCRHMGVKAQGCGNINYHGQTLIKAEGKFYIITTGYDEPKPRSYSITEVSGADLEKIMDDNHLKMWMFE
ncbi:MAG: Ig-like domain-containing protein [Lachnospiraceae bacterium]|nr:Ig-like domain-containing protein [Lachnospiraceae bacterium]